ncbi:flagellar hook-associated protein FlgK [Lentibacter algarum]|uniref:flagellar hook-associated protein FlgK n=1 Tax=Lentibacter algarum TaxID=576131 RepID=UPI001C076995|nr:flagellar hook-associated protein FlgK [Lentibacter algarum]MBU2981176.1 flagellar hook-associated protein FlgK [Lentibacter algarum]
MSLTGALSNAVSGLNAASRSAQVVSTNLANIMTDGYGRREVELGARYGTGGGVEITGVTRQQSPALVAEMRSVGSETAFSGELADFHNRLERLVGTPDSNTSLTARLADLEASFVSAASRPDLPGRLDAVVQDAATLARSLGEMSSGIQTMRQEADSTIDSGVKTLNTQLKQVEKLNGEIARGENNGFEISGLKDQRQVLIDSISEWIPLREIDRGNGRVALYTLGGAQLVDGPASELSFATAHTIVPQMTKDAGLLSGLSINGTEVSVDPESGPLRGGGRLTALFEVRDTHAVSAQSELDAVARDLVERFQDPAIDATRGPTDAGLLTDGGAAFAAIDEVGLSGRLQVNALVDSAQGGASWRLRDGMGAATQGAAGNASLLQDYTAALSADRSIASGGFAGMSRSATQLGANFSSGVSASRLSYESELAFAATRSAEIETMLLAEGVDSDQEMQKLLMIEQAYAANAQMMQTVEEMMDTLMGAIR